MFFWQWLITNGEVIIILANLASIVIMSIVAIALFMSAKQFKLQKESNQAILFDNISRRIRQLEDQWISCETIEKRENWYASIFNAFEYFAFFANRKKISSAMIKFYKSGIEIYVERLRWEKYSEVLEEYKKLPKEQLSELRKYYKDEIKKSLPF